VRFAWAKQPHYCEAVSFSACSSTYSVPESTPSFAQLPSAPIPSLPSVHHFPPCFPFHPSPSIPSNTPPLKAQIQKWTKLCTGNVFKQRFHIRWLSSDCRRLHPFSATTKISSWCYFTVRLLSMWVIRQLSTDDAETSHSIWITSPFAKMMGTFFEQKVTR